MRKFAAVSLMFLLAQSGAVAQDKTADGVWFRLAIKRGLLVDVWLNRVHVHQINPCAVYPPRYDRDGVIDRPGQTARACLRMDGHDVRHTTTNRSYESVGPYAEVVRYILDLPNPTTPSGSIAGPATATAGEPVTLTASVVDPDFGDSWTYAWAESSATRNGGSFSAQYGMVTDYTPAMAGTVVLWFQITDSAGQRSSSISHQIAVSAAAD